MRDDQKTPYTIYAGARTHTREMVDASNTNEDRASKCFLSLVFGVRFRLSHFTIGSLLFSWAFRHLSMSGFSNDDMNAKGAKRNVI